MMPLYRRCVFVCWMCLVAFTGTAQNDSLKTGFVPAKFTRPFFQTSVGLELGKTGAAQARYEWNNEQQIQSVGAAMTPRLVLGSLLFWGHADVYLSVPLASLPLNDAAPGVRQVQSRSGIETGLRLYPWAIEQNRLRPFVGVGIQSYRFQMEAEGLSHPWGFPVYEKVIYPLQTGLTWVGKRNLATLGVQYTGRRSFQYPLAQEAAIGVTAPSWALSLGWVRYWRGGQGLQQPNTLRQLLPRSAQGVANRQGQWYVGAGLSGGQQISRSSFLKTNYPYLYNDHLGGVMPDLVAGRYWPQRQLFAGLSYRMLQANAKGFDTRLHIRRHSIMAETYRYLFNWLGFLPFAGGTVSYENLHVRVNGAHYSVQKPALGIIAGWDVRLNKKGNHLLRTSFRWAPGLSVDIGGERMMFDHLENNFIQWVHILGNRAGR